MASPSADSFSSLRLKGATVRKILLSLILFLGLFSNSFGTQIGLWTPTATYTPTPTYTPTATYTGTVSVWKTALATTFTPTATYTPTSIYTPTPFQTVLAIGNYQNNASVITIPTVQMTLIPDPANVGQYHMWFWRGDVYPYSPTNMDSTLDSRVILAKGPVTFRNPETGSLVVLTNYQIAVSATTQRGYKTKNHPGHFGPPAAPIQFLSQGQRSFLNFVSGIATFTPTNTLSPTPTYTSTPTFTGTVSLWETAITTYTPTPTYTFTPTKTPTFNATATYTRTNTYTPTPTYTTTPTYTSTATLPAGTNTFTPVNTPTNTNTYTPTNSYTNTPSYTPTPTFTPTNTPSN